MEQDDNKPKRTKRIGAGVKHDGDFRSGKPLKIQKNRVERRKAKLDPECEPGYGRYRGWES